MLKIGAKRGHFFFFIKYCGMLCFESFWMNWHFHSSLSSALRNCKQRFTIPSIKTLKWNSCLGVLFFPRQRCDIEFFRPNLNVYWAEKLHWEISRRLFQKRSELNRKLRLFVANTIDPQMNPLRSFISQVRTGKIKFFESSLIMTIASN